MKYKAIDLFCGCGGLSYGAQQAGFEILAGVDLEKNYIQTFSYNFPDALSICKSVDEVDADDLMNKIGISYGELDLLVGGPPCQGFSKNVPRSQRQLDSDNNKLVLSFLDKCKKIYPKWILMENVAEMRNGFDNFYTEEIVNFLSGIGYKVSHGVHNSADYGVPQSRRRAFFIARRDGLDTKIPNPTHHKEGILGRERQISVWEAIGDLPSLSAGESCSSGYNPDVQPNSYQLLMRRSDDILNHNAKKLSEVQMDRIKCLKPGQGIKDLPDNLRPKGGYSGAYGRLTKDMVMPTITRWVFHPGSGRFTHPVDDRLITIREAARLHSFDDSFIFQGTYTQQAGQLGNSVPPLLAKIMAESFLV